MTVATIRASFLPSLIKGLLISHKLEVVEKCYVYHFVSSQSSNIVFKTEHWTNDCVVEPCHPREYRHSGFWRVRHTTMDYRLAAILEQGIENMADGGVKSMEEIQRSQTASLHSMENQIELLAKMIVNRLLSSLPNTMKRISKEQAERSP
ncbi:hypothetical protein M9H77_17626 [Catharanthus roseus]|uniref:Uncharacterized protein n=1 Tax=Catharanthus roseus TaxID=4058 RepID=A0ACC0B547_CATRO|nr:hypothetical protein M9H77_17626 [Catharanthus roseus]